MTGKTVEGTHTKVEHIPTKDIKATTEDTKTKVHLQDQAIQTLEPLLTLTQDPQTGGETIDWAHRLAHLGTKDFTLLSTAIHRTPMAPLLVTTTLPPETTMAPEIPMGHLLGALLSLGLVAGATTIPRDHLGEVNPIMVGQGVRKATQQALTKTSTI